MVDIDTGNMVERMARIGAMKSRMAEIARRVADVYVSESSGAE